MKTILSLLLLLSFLGFLNHTFPDKWNKAQVIQTIPINPPKVEMVQSVPIPIETTPTPHPVIIPVVSIVVTPVPSPEIHKPWVKPDTTNFPKSIVLNDGTKYENVKVLDVSPDAVSIMHSNGVSLVDIQNLPKNLQNELNYDPYWAKAAADKRSNDEQTLDQKIISDNEVLASNQVQQNVLLQQQELAQNKIDIQNRINQLNQQINDLIQRGKDNDSANNNHISQGQKTGKIVSSWGNGDGERAQAAQLQLVVNQLQAQLR